MVVRAEGLRVRRRIREKARQHLWLPRMLEWLGLEAVPVSKVSGSIELRFHIQMLTLVLLFGGLSGDSGGLMGVGAGGARGASNGEQSLFAQSVGWMQGPDGGSGGMTECPGCKQSPCKGWACEAYQEFLLRYRRATNDGTSVHELA